MIKEILYKLGYYFYRACFYGYKMISMFWIFREKYGATKRTLGQTRVKIREKRLGPKWNDKKIRWWEKQ